MHADVAHMSRALRLARRGLGSTAPNPAVGAILVKDGRIIGEGYHRQAGGPHAEVSAIENATESVRGATLYCTLEPCCHEGPHKRTPPCTRRIIAEGIRRVVVAALDPNPEVNGRGVDILRGAGVEVTIGPLADAAERMNEVFAANVRLGRPFVHLKAAQTLDGYVATERGDSRWITDRAARTEAHRLRALYDAVLVGAETVRRDDPSLTVRHVEGCNPVRVILAGRRPLPDDAQVFTDDLHKATLVYRPEAGEATVDLRRMLHDLRQRSIGSVLVEGGARVLASFMAQSLWDKLTLFVAPRLLGGGIPVFSGFAPETISEAIKLQEYSFGPIGNGYMVSGYRAPRELFGITAVTDSAGEDAGEAADGERRTQWADGMFAGVLEGGSGCRCDLSLYSLNDAHGPENSQLLQEVRRVHGNC